MLEAFDKKIPKRANELERVQETISKYYGTKPNAADEVILKMMLFAKKDCFILQSGGMDNPVRRIALISARLCGDILKLVKQQGLSTCQETSGYCNEVTMRRIMEHTMKRI